ncbi:FAD binding domain-containing protein [Mycena sp. CBHHK59/15]|nr:FAD binding domain-containing protein [Mycena sp. CBHHK59/15]
MSDSKSNRVDVLLVGGGPVSLLITVILVRAGLKILTVEQRDKFEQGLYGRACMLYAGSLEILDLLGVYDGIADIGFTVGAATTFKDGIQSTSRGWSFVHNALERSHTMFKFSLSIRQKHLEDAVRDAIAEVDREAVRAPVKLLSYRTVGSAAYPVIAIIEEEGKTREIHCKYLVGADGGRSTVRSVGKFAFPGTASPYKWVRLDAVVRTNMPSSRSKGVAIESKKHGNILWTPTDNGRTRIGFVNITAEVIMEVAKEVLLPFTLEFLTLDWWTVYEIGQRIAETFRAGPVFLAGDAAHTHSSGAAQGMNTGIHDAINLGWKLAGVLGSLYHEDILDTYNTERRNSAERVVELDRDVASLISGKIPDHFRSHPDADANDYLEQVHSENADFTVGLGVSYDANLINQIPEQDDRDLPSVEIGHRAPDGPVFRPGRAIAQPLRTMVRYIGRFWVLVFAGKLEPTADGVRLNSHCAEAYSSLCSTLVAAGSVFQTRPAPWDFLTLLSGNGSLQPSETLGAHPLGKTLYDFTGDVFARYGVNESRGAIVVVRPDGVVSFKTTLDGAQALSDYFGSFILRGTERNTCVQEVPANGSAGGEIDVEGEEESTYC